MSKNAKKTNEKKINAGKAALQAVVKWLRSGVIWAGVTRVFQVMIMFMIVYPVVMGTATGIVPTIGAYVVQAMGINYDTQMLDVIALWCAPAAFLILAVFAAELCIFILIWKWLGRCFAKSRKKRYETLAEKYEADDDDE